MSFLAASNVNTTETREPNYSGGHTMPRWTDEARAKQAALIRTWRPWEQSTGPVTPDGKKIVAANSPGRYWRERLRLTCWMARHMNRLRAGLPVPPFEQSKAEFYRRAQKAKLKCPEFC